MVLTQLIVIMLAAPAATAGAICVDKSRGTLHHVFVTDLTDREIVLGKLVGGSSRSSPSLPAASLYSRSGDCLAESITGGSSRPPSWPPAWRSSRARSRCSSPSGLRKPQHALLATYAVLAIWLLVYPVFYELLGGPVKLPRGRTPIPLSDELAFLFASNPIASSLAPIMCRSSDVVRLLAFLAGSVVVSALVVAVTILRLRPVVIGQADRKIRRERADAPLRILDYVPGPPLDGNPVLWREWHRKRPTRWTGRFWTMYAVLSAAASLFAIFAYFSNPRGIGPSRTRRPRQRRGRRHRALAPTISATSSLAEERDRGSLDVIMTTPLSTAMILWGKWWGTFAMVPRLAILPIWVCGGLSLVSGNWLAPSRCSA